MASAGCGGSQSAAPTQSSTSATYVSTDFAWLGSKAEPWNHKLNSDQNAILAATNASSEVTAGAFFARLSAACHPMSVDVGIAQNIVHAPSATLDKAWEGMLARCTHPIA
jgi:esterase/lipase superfamily enzyme